MSESKLTLSNEVRSKMKSEFEKRKSIKQLPGTSYLDPKNNPKGFGRNKQKKSQKAAGVK